MTKDLDALPLPELLERAASMIEEDYESTTECHTIDGVWPDDEWSKGVKTLVDEQAKVVKSLRSRADALRKALEGREPVAWRVRRSDGEHELFFHEPTAKQRAECFVPHSSAEPLYTSPPPKSDEARDAERYRWLLRNYLRFSLQDEALKHGSLDAAIDAALAAQQKGGE